MMISPSAPPHASRWQILLVFIIALLLFISLRWQPEAWLRSQINTQAQQHAIILSYKHLHMHGLSIEATSFSLQRAERSSPIMLDSLRLTPDWSSLLRGHIAVQVHARWQAQDIHATIIKQDNTIILRDILAKIDATHLQPILAKNIPLPLNIHGNIQLSGSMLLNTNIHPLGGSIKLSWDTASIRLSASHIALGNYQLILQSPTKNNPEDNRKNHTWQWDLTGGNAFMLSGKGSIDTSSQQPQVWPLTGTIRMQANKEARILADLLGNKATEFHLSGNVRQPHLQTF